MLKKTKEQIQESISRGEIKKALNQTLKVLKATENASLYNEALLLSARFEALNREKRTEVISDNEANIISSRITNSLLNLIDKINFKPIPPKNWILWLAFLGATIIIIVGFYFYIETKDTMQKLITQKQETIENTEEPDSSIITETSTETITTQDTEQKTRITDTDKTEKKSPPPPKPKTATIDFSKRFHHFGEIELTEYPICTFNIQNTGIIDYKISNITSTSPNLKIINFPLKIRVRKTNSIIVQYIPLNEGQQTATINITDNSESGHQKLTIAVKIIKPPPIMTLFSNNIGIPGVKMIFTHDDESPYETTSDSLGEIKINLPKSWYLKPVKVEFRKKGYNSQDKEVHLSNEIIRLPVGFEQK